MIQYINSLVEKIIFINTNISGPFEISLFGGKVKCFIKISGAIIINAYGYSEIIR